MRRDALTIYLPKGQIRPPENPYGRLIANAGTYRALAASVDHVHVATRQPDGDFADDLGVDADCVTVGSLLQTSPAARAGVLFSGQPYLSEPAWVRRHAGRDTSYSIVGSIFAFSSPEHREQMMHSALAPLHDWDALVCSSPTLRATVEGVFDRWQEYLAERLGATRLPRPQLPVIPFGCDVARISRQADDEGARVAARARLGIGPEAVMVYFLGRLSYYDKAFPQAMFSAVSRAATASGVETHFVMTGWFPHAGDRQRYEQAALALAPNVPVTFLDGNDPDVVAQCWAAADVFLLLSDTIIETFGQALVEAMAAGLPLVVSDWDGYRSIVKDGFLIPTLGAPAGPVGQTLALMDSLGMIGYPTYAGAVAAHTAVDVGRAAEALEALLTSPALRQELGDLGRRRAFETFAWPVVADQYLQLFAELDARRAGQSQAARMNPLRADPFMDFSTLPTDSLNQDTVVWLTHVPVPDTDLGAAFASFRGSDLEMREVLDRLAEGPMRVADLVADVPPSRRPFVRMTVMWLAKAGAIAWR